MKFETMKLTCGQGHGFLPGDIVHVNFAGEGKMAMLKRLFTKPRVSYISAIEGNTMLIDFRRMTWAEWRRALIATIFA